MRIANAVVPVAGAGTRLLPSTKAQPKEMLPVGRKPLVQYVVEELEAAAIESILFVTGRRKRAIEDHFDVDPELRELLQKRGRTALLDELKFEDTGVSFFYTRQSEQLGLGHAVACARDFAAGEPFVVALGDSIITRGAGRQPLVRRLIDAYEQAEGGCVIAFQEVPPEAASRYGIAAPAGDGDVFEVRDLVEKPAPGTAPSNLAISARYVLPPEIFDAIDQTAPGKNGEIQLTDAIRLLMKRGRKVIGVRLADGERRYDIGNFGSYFRTFVDFALADEELGPELAEYLRERLAQDGQHRRGKAGTKGKRT
jgi:UTP--glucose-1-phosphate uridylyltransferase